MRPDELEHLRERLDALGPAPRAKLLHVLTTPDFDCADRDSPTTGERLERVEQYKVWTDMETRT